MIRVGSTYRLKHSIYHNGDDQYLYLAEGERARVIGMTMNNDTNFSTYTLEFENGLILNREGYHFVLLNFELVEER